MTGVLTGRDQDTDTQRVDPVRMKLEFWIQDPNS
jgi:hypothetical protein